MVDHAAAYGTPQFLPAGVRVFDTGYVVAGIPVEQVTGLPLHEIYRGSPSTRSDGHTRLEGHEPVRIPEAAHHYSGELD